MNLCDDGHDEVVYTTRSCPACNLKDDLASLEADYEALGASSEQKISELETQLADYRANS